MNLWTYKRAFSLGGSKWRVEAAVGLQALTSRLYRETELVDEQTLLFAAGYRNLVHTISPANLWPQSDAPERDASRSASQHAVVEVGYFNWLNMGIEVSLDGETVFASHPGRDIHFAEKKNFKSSPAKERAAREAVERWERNKYSIYADMGLGALFFLIGKFTGDLTLAALWGAAAGLALVLAQRYVRVDLLGGFAVFGTVMLLVSAVFSLVFQSEYMVQMKSTILGLLTASLFFGDGLLRRGAYFGARMQRYMPQPVNTARMAMGLGMLGLFMAGVNYAVATWMSEDAWLTYTTFLDLPLSIGLAYGVFFWSREPLEQAELVSG